MTSTKKKRLVELDSLRGIAAAVVVLAHISHYYPAQAAFEIHSYFSFFSWTTVFSGRLSVLLFFCISGFVLSYPYFSGQKNISDIKLDLMFRLPRLVVPIFIAGIIGFALQSIAVAFLENPSTEQFDSAGWVNRWDTTDWGWLETFKFLLVDVIFFYDRQHSFNINLWTMPVEFAFSFVVFSCVAIHFQKPLIALALFVIFLILLLQWKDLTNVKIQRVFDGCQFLFGIYLSSRIAANKFDTLSDIKYSKFWVILLLLGFIISVVSGNLRAQGSIAGFFGDHLASILIFLSFVLIMKNLNFLQSKPLMVMGNISFQLYLIHGAIFFFTFQLISNLNIRYNILMFSIGAIVSISLSVITAKVLLSRVETPITKYLKKKLVDIYRSDR